MWMLRVDLLMCLPASQFGATWSKNFPMITASQVVVTIQGGNGYTVMEELNLRGSSIQRWLPWVPLSGAAFLMLTLRPRHGAQYPEQNCRSLRPAMRSVSTTMDKRLYSASEANGHAECGFSYQTSTSPTEYLIWSVVPSYSGGSCGTANVGRSWSDLPNYGCNNMVTYVRAGTHGLGSLTSSLSAVTAPQQVQSHPWQVLRRGPRLTLVLVRRMQTLLLRRRVPQRDASCRRIL